MAWRLIRLLQTFVLLMIAAGCAHPPKATSVPSVIEMTPAEWTLSGDGAFKQMEGFPAGLIELKQGHVISKRLSFADGTIDFDIHLVNDGIPGIRFHRTDNDTSEELYVRPGPNCRASDDCIQYTPWVNGANLWDLFPQFQAAAPIDQSGWNHMKLVISGRMNVHVNGSASPSLVVGRLESDAARGGISLSGPATYANVTIAQGATDGLRPEAEHDPTDDDKRYLRRWRLSKRFVIVSTYDAAFGEATGAAPPYGRMPTSASSWEAIAAERNGLTY